VRDGSPDAAPPNLMHLASENAMLRQHLATLGDIALAGDLPVDDLLQRLVEASRSLLGARYAALGVFDERNRVKQFFTAGLSAQDRAAIGNPPVGTGLLGLIATERRFIRVQRIADHPQSSGFPPHHPRMSSFLGGPIVHHGVVLGNLYLTDPIGATEFTEADERLLVLLASQAAAAIENAQRFARARREERTSRALFEVGKALASLTAPADLIELVIHESRRILGADLIGICVQVPGENSLRWTALRGSLESTRSTDPIPLLNSVVGQVLSTGVAFLSDDVQQELDRTGRSAFLAREQIRSVVMVPLGGEHPRRGVLVAGWRRPRALPEEAAGVLQSLAERAAIALAQAELHLREQAALRQAQLERSSLEAIFDSMTDAVLTTDLAGRIVRLNRRAVSWAQDDATSAIGQLATAAFPLVDQVGRAATASERQVTSQEANLHLPSGELIPVESVVSPIRDANGDILGAVQVLRDLRPQREVEQLKANIISLVSHELRTPLSHIKGYASSLLQSDVSWDPETQRDFITSIERQADRLARLITDLLEISRLDAGGAANLERVPLHPAMVVERGIRQARPNAGNHPIRTSVDENLPDVLADLSHVERVMSNLIENAAKYSPPDSPIDVAVSKLGKKVVFSVGDRGTGLTAEEKRHLFERFYRSPRVKHRTPGTGLGLAICREIIVAHRGEIWAESVGGEGSVFHFTLPCADASDGVDP
jgi:PAS domain S-box-containing protein